MERSQLFDLMGKLQLYGMKAAFDEIMATAVGTLPFVGPWILATYDPIFGRPPMFRKLPGG